MLTLQWVVIGALVCAALVALERLRRLSRRVERLTESYWELRYEVGQLQARVNRLEPVPSDPVRATEPPGSTAFVPLSSLRR